MSNTLPSPPSSRETTPGDEDILGTNTAALTRRLDDILEEYLEQLDEYTQLRAQLSASFSSGFLSLANAQRTSNLGAGRRYGTDGYDERMKALRRVEFQQQSRTNKKHGATLCSVDTFARQEIQQHKAGVEEMKSITEVQAQYPKAVGEHEKSTSSEDKPDPAYRDPVTWYGILVPSALRQCQSKFMESVQTTIPALVSCDSCLSMLEEEIRMLRKQLRSTDHQSDLHARHDGGTGNAIDGLSKEVEASTI